METRNPSWYGAMALMWTTSYALRPPASRAGRTSTRPPRNQRVASASLICPFELHDHSSRPCGETSASIASSTVAGPRTAVWAQVDIRLGNVRGDEVVAARQNPELMAIGRDAAWDRERAHVLAVEAVLVELGQAQASAILAAALRGDGHIAVGQ